MKLLRIIIADDHPLFRAGLQQSLLRIKPGARILVTSNGLDIIGMMEKESIDLIFLHTSIDGIDGLAITRCIRKVNSNVKIIIVGGLENRSAIMKVFHAGANGYLDMRTDEIGIQQAICNVMKGEKHPPENQFGKTVSAQSKNESLLFNLKYCNELSEREKEVLALICNQDSSKEIAHKLFLTEKTVETHRIHLMIKTGSRNVVGLIMYAIKQGYFVPKMSESM